MQLKTYRAPDLSTALARARRELGPDAYVLATNEIKGGLGLTRVEITVGIDRRVVGGAEELKRLASEVDRLRHEMKPNGPPAERPVAAPRRKPRRLATTFEDDLNPALRSAVETLSRSGLSHDLALRFARLASRDLRAHADADQLIRAAEGAMRTLLPFKRSASIHGVWFIVGPPGAGKTTTVAKLLSRVEHTGDASVVFAQADGERVGAMEEASVYSRHLGAQLLPVLCPDDLTLAAKRVGSRGSILVDTSGIGATDDRRLERLFELRRAVPRAEVAVLVPAGLHESEARRVLARFDRLRPTCVALSRVDDGGRLGELVTAVASSRLPLAFVTNGHRVPDDLEDASPRGLTALLLRSGFHAETRQEIAR